MIRTKNGDMTADHDKWEGFDIYDDGDGEATHNSSLYRGYVRRKGLVVVLSLMALFACIIIAAHNGPLSISTSDIIRYILTFDNDGMGGVVWNIRMVRIVGAILAGSGLAVAGVVMQCILRNPLASPYTLGISSAAAFGASFAIIFLNAGSSITSIVSISNPYVTTISAFLFSLLATGAILLLTRVTRVSGAEQWSSREWPSAPCSPLASPSCST